MHKIKVGDLCRPTNVLPVTKTIIVSDEHLLDELFRTGTDCLMAVTARVTRTPILDRSLASLNSALCHQHDIGSTEVFQVIIAAGLHTGRVGYVPSFWLEVIMSPRSC